MKYLDKNQSRTMVLSQTFYGLYFGLLGLLFIRIIVLRQDVGKLWDFSLLFFIASLYLIIRLKMTQTWHEIHDEQGSLLFAKHLIQTGISTFFFAFIMILFGIWSFSSPREGLVTLIGALTYAIVWLVLPLIFKRRSRP